MPILHFVAGTPTPARDFDDWVRHHEHDGFFVSVRAPNNAVLHRASCALVGAVGRSGSNDDTERFCSCDRFALTDWARASSLELTRCDCV